MIVLLCGMALAGPWAGKDGDVDVSRSATVTLDQLAPVLQATRVMALYPEECAHWNVPFTSDAAGSKAEVTYRAAGMRRRLDAVVKTVSHTDTEVRLDLDHLGNKGFVTQFRAVASEGGVMLSMNIGLLPPPKLVASYFFRKVHPAWTDCDARTLDAIVTAAGG